MKIAINNFGIEISNISTPKVAPLSKKNCLKVIYFYDLLQKINDVKGCIVECGVGCGRSLSILSILNNKKRNIFGIDSFNGYPKLSKEDGFQLKNIKEGGHKFSEKYVRKYLLSSGVEEPIRLIRATFDNPIDVGNIALLHIDVVLYESYKKCLNIFYPLVVSGGIIALDEYHIKPRYNGAYEGGKKSIDEYFKNKNIEILRSNIISRHFIIKP